MIAAGGVLQCGDFWRQVAKVIGRLPRRRGTARPSRILEERYGRRSTTITSQFPVDKWHALIGDPTYADANRIEITTTRAWGASAAGYGR